MKKIYRGSITAALFLFIPFMATAVPDFSYPSIGEILRPKLPYIILGIFLIIAYKDYQRVRRKKK